MRTLIENLEFVVTADRNDRVLRNASVVVEDDRIADIRPAAALTDLRPVPSLPNEGSGASLRSPEIATT